MTTPTNGASATLVMDSSAAPAASDLTATLQRLGRQAIIRSIDVYDRSGRLRFSLPMVVGAAGMVIMGPLTALALAAVWLTRASVRIQFTEAPPTLRETLDAAPWISLDDETE